jgi:AraC-like DNA-binding protein
MNNNVYDQVVEYVMCITDEEFANLSVAVLAYSLKIDRYKLSRQFKRQSEMTLEEFLFKEKMARAAFLLKTFIDITVKEVSERIGFCTCDYFIRKFKQYYGVAPGRYKEFKSISNGNGNKKQGYKKQRKLIPKCKTLNNGYCSTGEKDGQIQEFRDENPCDHCHYKSFAQGIIGVDYNRSEKLNN